MTPTKKPQLLSLCECGHIFILFHFVTGRLLIHPAVMWCFQRVVSVFMIKHFPCVVWSVCNGSICLSPRWGLKSISCAVVRGCVFALVCVFSQSTAVHSASVVGLVIQWWRRACPLFDPCRAVPPTPSALPSLSSSALPLHQPLLGYSWPTPATWLRD